MMLVWAEAAVWHVGFGNLFVAGFCIAIVYSLWIGSNNVAFLILGDAFSVDGDSPYERKLLKFAAWGLIAASLIALWPALSSPHESGHDMESLLIMGVVGLLGLIPPVLSLWALSDDDFHEFMGNRYIARLEEKIATAE